jgi:predicted GIY-YIG superfamily endonuclease
MYFIKIDTNTIKYGISSSITRRLKEHYRKFVKDLKITNDLTILSIIGFENKDLNVYTEKRLKECIKVNQKLMKKYSETELFSATEFDYYIKKIDLFIRNIINDYDINDCEYVELTEGEINSLYDCVKTDKRLKYVPNEGIEQYDIICPRCGISFDDNHSLEDHILNDNNCLVKYIDVDKEELLNNYNTYYNDYHVKRIYTERKKTKKMNICLRCGKEFNSVAKHLRKKVCVVKWLNITADDMLKNYDEHYKKYKEMFAEKYKYYCRYCNAPFTKSQNCCRHEKHRCNLRFGIQTGTNKLSIDEQNIASDHINNCNNQTNNFGEEEEICKEHMLAILNNCISKKIEDMIPIYVEKRWIDIENNRNVDIRDLNRGIGGIEIYENSKWNKAILNSTVDKIRNISMISIENFTKEMNGSKEYDDIKKQIIDAKINKKIIRYINENIKIKLINGRDKIRKTKKDRS